MALFRCDLMRVLAFCVTGAVLLVWLSPQAVIAEEPPKKEEAAPKPRGEKITLKLNLPKGAKRLVQYDMVLTSGSIRKMNLGYVILMEVKDVDAKTGDHTVSVRYERVKMSVNSQGVSMAYDSADKDATASPLGRVLSTLVGTTVTATLGSNGVAKKVEGLDKVANASIARQLDQTFHQMFATLPTMPVDIRDSWTVKRAMPGGAGVVVDTAVKQTLWDRQKGKAIIKVDMKMHADKQRLEVNATLKGNFTVDEKTGWTEGGDLTMAIGGENRGFAMTATARIKIKGMAVKAEAKPSE